MTPEHRRGRIDDDVLQELADHHDERVRALVERLRSEA